MSNITIQQAIDLATRHQESGNLHQAELICRQILQAQPGQPDAMQLLGMIAYHAGKSELAIDLIRRAIAVQPNYPRAHNNLGNLLIAAGKPEEAIASFRTAVAQQPDYATAHNNLGTALYAKGQMDEAVAACRRAIELNPRHVAAWNNLANALKDQGELDEAIECCRKAISIQPEYAACHSNLVFALHYHPDYDAGAIFRELRCWNERRAQPLNQFILPHENDRNASRRLKIGYVSSDFRDGTTSKFLLPLLEAHDHGTFEIVCYSDALTHDAITDRIRAHADVWHETSMLPDAQLADLIHQDQIDILVDLSCHTARNRLLVFARKPAPVQVTYLAYCSSTGMDAVDYRITDPHLDPPGLNDSFYSEKPIHLPETYWCYRPPNVTQEVQPPPALSAGYVTFGCLNNFCKITNPTKMTWCRLLQVVPNSRLMLHAHEGSHRQRLVDLFAAGGIEPERLSFVGHVPFNQYMELYHRIDIGLDPFPYGGGTTTCDGLWMGVPVVTLVGQRPVSRAGLSLLSNVGLPELAAKSEDEYVKIASDLAGDLPRLTQLRSTMRERIKASPLMDAPRFARNMEAAYRDMWQRWCGQ